MDNEEYFRELEIRTEELKLLRKEGISLSTGIIGQSLLMEDLFFFTSADRCIHLLDGFIALLRDRNLTCAGVLLRIQMDNCMRTYAAFIAQDKNSVIDCVIEGKSIRNEKDRNGKKMTDGYLKDEVSKLDSVFSQVYDQASGFVHLSEKAFYQTIVECKDNTIEFQVGIALPEKWNTTLLEAADAFIHFVRLHYKMLIAVAESKKRCDSLQIDGE